MISRPSSGGSLFDYQNENVLRITGWRHIHWGKRRESSFQTTSLEHVTSSTDKSRDRILYVHLLILTFVHGWRKRVGASFSSTMGKCQYALVRHTTQYIIVTFRSTLYTLRRRGMLFLFVPTARKMTRVEAMKATKRERLISVQNRARERQTELEVGRTSPYIGGDTSKCPSVGGSGVLGGGRWPYHAGA